MNKSKKFTKGDWTTCHYSICEVLCNGELVFTVATEDADKLIKLLEEHDELLDMKSKKWQCRLCGFTGTIEHICRKRDDVDD